MKKLLLASVAVVAVVAAGPAGAADLPRGPVYKAPPPVVAPVPYFNWTACYIGGHVGGGWGRKDFSDVERALEFVNIGNGGFFVGNSDPETVRVHTSGFLGGGQIGCDYQFAPNWVIGIGGDFSGTDIKGSAVDPFFPSSFGKTFHAKTDWLASVTGRLGWSWDRWMLYAKGGVAWASDKYHIDEVGAFYDASETRTGWTVGVGVEWAFWSNWSAFIEYDFYGFGNRDLQFQCNEPTRSCGSSPPLNIKQDINVVKFGINWRFGGIGKGKAPVMARY